MTTMSLSSLQRKTNLADESGIRRREQLTRLGQKGQGVTADAAAREAIDAGSLAGAALPAATAHPQDRLRTIVEHQQRV
ncbi:MAG: hypothetical protein OSB03_04260 [Vicinamibacterales bacterium]|nr:hypothetical protein [Vicinamibacterales bacterium]